MRFLQLFLLAACLLPALHLNAEAYKPTIARFDGNSSISFPADLSLDFSDYATIEFWVAATWTELDYDPTILSYVGPEGPRFALILTGDRQGIGMLAGENWDAIGFDFSDGKMHHVAFVVLGDETDIYIDGEFGRTLAVSIVDVPARRLNLGSYNGVDGGFPGALAGLRIWDAPLDGDYIETYRQIDVTSERGRRHPMIDSLVAISYFDQDRRDLLLLREPIPSEAIVDLD